MHALTWNILFFSISAVAEDTIESRAIGDKQCKRLMACKRRAGAGGAGEKSVCTQHDVNETMTQMEQVNVSQMCHTVEQGNFWWQLWSTYEE